MAKPLTVKAILQYPEGLELGSSPDVRRFKVDKGSDAQSDLFRRLQDTLPTVFPDIQGLDYSLFYKDEDGEMVEFSSMDELQAALDNLSDNVFKLYIIVNYDGAVEESSPSSSDSDGEAVAKRVRFTQAGKRFRKRIRRRRKAALSEQAVQPEYRRAVRLLLKQLHKAERQGGKPVDPGDEDKATLAALSPDVQTFVQKIAEEWHSKLAQKRPRVVARRVRMQKRTFPAGMERDHFQWLCRYLARWHRRNAGKCQSMAGWSSGETGDDTSGDEEALIRKIRKKREIKKREKKTKSGASSETDTSADSSDDKVSQDFRKDVRVLMSQLHKKKKPEGADDTPTATITAPGTLTPEVQTFIQKMAEDWHSKLSQKRPRFVAKKVKKEQKKSLPQGLQKDAFSWLISFFKRWHRRHADKCEAMAGWSSGVESAATSGDEKKKKKEEKEKDEKKEKKDKKDRKEKKEKKEKKKEEKAESSSSSSSSSDSEEEKEDPVSKEFRKDVRILVSQLHKKNKKAAKKGEKPEEEQTTPTSLAPEVQAFVQQLVQDWHTKLSQKPPRMVAKIMRKKEERLPAGLDKDHFRWVCRFMARWHRKNAGKCDVMAGYSSGETADDTSGNESEAEKRRAKRLKRLAKQKDAVSESEDTDCLEKACTPVSPEFRGQVRAIINQLHKSGGRGDKPLKVDSSTLPPQVQEFLRLFSQEWHAKLSQGKRPRAASTEMKEEQKTPPAGLDNEQFVWLTCYMTRWHRKHADKCDVMPAFAVGEKTHQA